MGSITQNHLFRAVDRRPCAIARGVATIHDLDPLAIVGARIDLGVHDTPVLHIQHKVLLPLQSTAPIGTARTPGRSMTTSTSACIPGKSWLPGLGRSISARSVRSLPFKAQEVRVTLPAIGVARNARTSTLAFVPL